MTVHIAVCTDEAMDVHKFASKDKRIVREEVPSVRTAQVSVNLMSMSIHCH